MSFIKSRTPESVDRTPLRIGIIAPPVLPLPPTSYAGTERIIATLATSLHIRGHDVTVFAPGDSCLPCKVVPTVPRALWPAGHHGNLESYFQDAVRMAWNQRGEFDVIHSHLGELGFAMARESATPVVTTMHGRLDVEGIAGLIDRFRGVPLVAISDSQRRWHPQASWLGTVHHGLEFGRAPWTADPGDYLLVVGRLTREKGIAEAIDVAKRTGRRLVIAAKCHELDERAFYEAIVRPAVDAGIVDWRGEVPSDERDELMAGALATLMLGAWPEPFGLVAIESMATGTPVIARRAGAYTEIVEHGYNGYLVDDLDEAVLAVGRIGAIDRRAVGGYARGRFSADRMTTRYEAIFHRLVVARREKSAARPTAVLARTNGRGTADPHLGLSPVPAASLATRL